MTDLGTPVTRDARQFSSDPIIRAVQEQTIEYPKNKDFVRLTRSSFGRRFIYPVAYIGEDEGRYMSYVIAKSDGDKAAKAFFSIEEIFSANSADGPIWTDPTILKLYSLIGLGFVLTIASILLAFYGDKSLLPVFTGLLGSIIGYFIGERQSIPNSGTSTT